MKEASRSCSCRLNFFPNSAISKNLGCYPEHRFKPALSSEMMPLCFKGKKSLLYSFNPHSRVISYSANNKFRLPKP